MVAATRQQQERPDPEAQNTPCFKCGEAWGFRLEPEAPGSDILIALCVRHWHGATAETGAGQTGDLMSPPLPSPPLQAAML